MQEQINMITTLAPCGMNCELCHSFQNKKKNCPGCRRRSTNCVITRCDKRKLYCFECSQYPCRRLRQLDERYRTHYQHEHDREFRIYQRVRGKRFFTATTGEIPMSRLWKVTNGTLRGLHILQATEEGETSPSSPQDITILNKLTAS